MPLKGNLLEPISADRPCGDSIRDKPIYDQLKEARREEDDLAQGDWKRERKVADYALVLKLGQKVLAEQSKDIEVATWLVEALLNRDGFAGFVEGLNLVTGLLETYWDKLYPRFDEEEFDPVDLASKLDFLGTKLNIAIKMQPVTASGISWVDYELAKKIPTKDEAYESEDKARTRAEAERDKKLLPEDFEREFEATPKAFYAGSYKTLEAVFAALDQLNNDCSERFSVLDADDQPSFYSLRATLEEFNQTIRIFLNRKREIEPDPVEEPEPDEEAAEEQGAAEADSYLEPSVAEAEPEQPTRKKAPTQALTPDPSDEADAFARVIRSARYLRELNPTDPVPFLLLRALRWGELRRSGNGNADLRQFAPPQTEIRQQLKTASLDGDWGAVLEAAEGAAGQPCGRAWIDLQRYAISALENLGYTAPAEAVVSLLRGLIHDFPDLVSQTLMDDTATANVETQAWLNVLFPSAAPEAEAEPEPEAELAYRSATRVDTDDETPPGEPDLFEQAQEMAARGNASGAISLLSSTIASERSGRGRFLRRVQLAQICLGVGRPGMARNLLDEVVKEVENRKLEEWESAETLAQTLALYFRSLGDSAEDEERKKELYAKICRLDPSQALSLGQMD